MGKNRLPSSPCCCKSALLFPRLCVFFFLLSFSFLGHPWWSRFPSPRVTAPTLAREWHKPSAAILWEQQATHTVVGSCHTPKPKPRPGTHTHAHNSAVVIVEIMATEESTHTAVTQGCLSNTHTHTHESGCGTLGSLLCPSCIIPRLLYSVIPPQLKATIIT